MAAVMAIVGGAIAVGAAVGKGISGYKAKKAAKNKQEQAAADLKSAQDGLKNVDTSNPFKDAKNAYAGLESKAAGLENQMAGLDNAYDGQENKYADMTNKMSGQKNAFDGLQNQFEGMENAFEDLTVNTQQAEFEAQQNQQTQANIMSSMGAAAGGSGIAALAQSMANQGSLQAAKASASIGAQESQNQKLAAQADEKINMATADEASKMQGQKAQEQSRLDTQSRSADMEIQKIQMSAEDRMQQAQLGEASKLQMAEATEGSRLQTQQFNAGVKEMEGEMEVQKLKGDGQLASANLEMQKQSTLLNTAMSQEQAATAQKSAANDSMWSGIGGIGSALGGMSDVRMKENIVKIKYSDSGIPIYHFNYKGDNTTWTGTMAQDLIALGKEHVVTKHTDGYYRVNYNLIDVDMIKVKPSPLKQLGKTPQEEMAKQKDMTNAGLDILSGAKARLNWDELQKDIRSIEPDSMKMRKVKDQLLRDKERKMFEAQENITLPKAYAKAGYTIVKNYKKELYKALEEEDEVAKGLVKTKLAALAQSVRVVKDNISEFYDDQFNPETLLSKGVSAQQISFATQMYCKNPELIVVFAVDYDVESGTTDYFGELVAKDQQYCVVYDFNGMPQLLNVIDGNKDMFIRNNLKATEYIRFLTETNELAVKANSDKAAVKIDLGRINYKIDTLFGYNDGSATQLHNELVMMFCHDSEVLRDGSTFKRHLYEHPNIENLNYGGFDWDNLEIYLPLGPGDKGHWADNIDDLDKLRLVDALINVDNPFFNINLLRTLVKEYYAYRIENAWWKGMGYPEGKLDVMRLKQNSLVEARFKKEKSDAAGSGQLDFLFDGKVYPTGMTKAKLKKMEEDGAKKMKEANPQLKK